MNEVESLKERISALQEEKIPIKSIFPNKWNFNVQTETRFKSLKATLSRFGKIYPIIVRKIAKDKYEIVDGEHRWKALRQLGVKMVPVKNLGVVSDILAKELMTILNQTRGSANLEKLGISLSRIVSTMEEEGENPLDLLPYEDDQFERLLASTKDFSEEALEPPTLDEEWDGVMESSHLCKKHTFKKVKMMRCKKCETLEELNVK